MVFDAIVHFQQMKDTIVFPHPIRAGTLPNSRRPASDFLGTSCPSANNLAPGNLVILPNQPLARLQLAWPSCTARDSASPPVFGVRKRGLLDISPHKKRGKKKNAPQQQA